MRVKQAQALIFQPVRNPNERPSKPEGIPLRSHRKPLEARSPDPRADSHPTQTARLIGNPKKSRARDLKVARGRPSRLLY